MPAGAGLVHQSDRGESLDKPVGVYAPVAPATVRRITERVMNVLNADAIWNTPVQRVVVNAAIATIVMESFEEEGCDQDWLCP